MVMHEWTIWTDFCRCIREALRQYLGALEPSLHEPPTKEDGRTASVASMSALSTSLAEHAATPATPAHQPASATGVGSNPNPLESRPNFTKGVSPRLLHQRY